MRWLAVIAVLGLPPAAQAMTDEARYPAATCAAFLEGRAAFADQSAYLDASTSDRALAAEWRNEAVRINHGNAGEVESFIENERKTMAFLFEAMILGADEAARDMHDRLVETCNVPSHEPASIGRLGNARGTGLRQPAGL